MHIDRIPFGLLYYNVGPLYHWSRLRRWVVGRNESKLTIERREMSMSGPLSSGMVAFFPWGALNEPIYLGASIRLLPYRVGKLPGDLQHATQLDLDGILSAYSNRPNVRVPAATIIEVDDWRTDIEDASIRPRLFRARTAIGFAALANRRLFVPHFD
jgi:hypothetical protein